MKLFFYFFSIVLEILSYNLIFCNNSIPLNNISPKIIGGQIVLDKKDFAYITSFRIQNIHICGGTIISIKHILTAAHCCYDTKNKKYKEKIVTIAAGGLQRNADKYTIIKNVEKLIPHEMYNPENIENDIAIVRILGTYHYWTTNLHPISLSAFKPTNALCTVSGWGVLKYNTTFSSHYLQYVNISIVDKEACRSFYGKLITSKMICAGGYGKDSCQGDSGGPLVCNNTLTGIVSWGNGCGKYPGVYTAVSKYLPWINHNINSSEKSSPVITYILLSLLSVIYVNY